MKERSKGLGWLVNVEWIVTPFLCLFFFGLCYALDLSVWIAITMTVGCVASNIVDMKTVKVPTKLIGSLTLRDFRAYLLRQKRQRKIQMAVGGFSPCPGLDCVDDV